MTLLMSAVYILKSSGAQLQLLQQWTFLLFSASTVPIQSSFTNVTCNNLIKHTKMLKHTGFNGISL